MELKEINKTKRLMKTSEKLENLSYAVNSGQFIFPLELVDLTVNII